jgi:hypothetical protein
MAGMRLTVEIGQLQREQCGRIWTTAGAPSIGQRMAGKLIGGDGQDEEHY